MKKLILTISTFFIFVCLFPQGTQAATFCGDKIVTLGSSINEIRDTCGPPTFIDEYRLEKTIQKYEKIYHPESQLNDHRGEDKTTTDEKGRIEQETVDHYKNLEENYRLVEERTFLIKHEVWTYNLGPDQFIRALIFAKDHLKSINTSEA